MERLRKGYISRLLCGKHKEKQHPPCCNYGLVTAVMSQITFPLVTSLLRCVGDTQGLTSALDLPVEHTKIQVTVIHSKNTHNTGKRSVSLSSPNSMNPDTDTHTEFQRPFKIPLGLLLLWRGLCMLCSTAWKHQLTSQGQWKIQTRLLKS